MLSIDLIRDLLSFDHWANLRVATALHGDGTPAAARELFGHVLLAQELWADRIEGVETVRGVEGRADVTDFGSVVGHAHDRLRSILANETEDSIHRVIEYHDLSGNPHATPLSEILVHVVNHGTHHRAQVASTLKRAQLVPPRIDYIVYSREKGKA